MPVKKRQVIFPVALVIGLCVPALPAATAASTPTSQRITGVVQTIIREHPRGQAVATAASTATPNDTSTVLRVGTAIVPLTDGSLPRTKDGTTVSVSVVPGAAGTKRVLSSTTISAPVAEDVPSTHQVYVALVRPVGIPVDPSLTSTSARAMVSGVSQYWSDQTGGQVSFTTARVASYRSVHGCADPYPDTLAMWNEALARMPEADGPGKHLVLVAPEGADAFGCYYGLGSIGAVEADGNLVFVSGLNQSLLAHELGHNLGLYHANSLRCRGTQDVPMVNLRFPGCQENAYDDLFDVMGYSGLYYGEGNLNAVHLDGMNLLPNAVRKIQANSGVTTVRITPLSTSADDRTLKVTDPSGARYFVEYRTKSGRDATASLTGLSPAWGVRVLRDDPGALDWPVPPSAGSYELDATPTSRDVDYNRSIPVGGTFSAASGKLTITVTAADAEGASLTIANSTAQALPSRVTLSVPTRAWMGATITASTKVTDLHGLVVANWPVTLQRLPKGSTTWRSLANLRTTSTGTVSYRFANGLSASYRWVTTPGSGTPSRFSRPVAVTSAARVVERRPAASMRYGRYLTVSGVVSSVPAPIVYIQYRYRGGSWRTGPRATVRGTVVSGRIAMNVRGTAYTRLHVRATRLSAGSTSNFYVTGVR
ncbi:MAG TPA: hypothetical protein VF391_05030 [Dermatophilaceae bacterium]